MKISSARHALVRVAELLAEVLGLPEADVLRETSDPRVDAVLHAGNLTFLVEWKPSAQAAPIAHASMQLKQAAARRGKRTVPLVAVPHMSDAGKRYCAEAGVSWIDLSGNMSIEAPGIRLHVEGRPNRFKPRGRPSDVFAPKSARIARWLLIHPDRTFGLRELAAETAMDPGFSSRILARLEREGLVARDESGAIRTADPEHLLDAWHASYDFSKHGITRGHIPARSSEALLHDLAAALDQHGVEYAATGLGAAWLLSRFAGFRLVTFYLRDPLGTKALADLDFREDERGANVWLVAPNDEGVFHGATQAKGIRCAHPVQIYLDLKAHPERAHEAAAHLRKILLTWKRHG